MRKIVLLGAAALLTLTACGSKASGSGAADIPATPSPEAPASQVLGPDGFGAIKLGGTEAEGAAAGLTWADVAGYVDRACPKSASIPQSGFPTVHLSTKLGIAVIAAAADTHTPEGIKVGSTLTDVKKAYPALKNEAGDPSNLGVNVTPVPGNPKASYRIFITDGKVVSLNLMLNDHGCFLV